MLYLVPSIALMAQTMREWSEQKSLPLRYVGICSDTRAGRNDEDASLLELDYPVTTDLEKIQAGLQAERPHALTAVFCTYQSLPLVAAAQAEGAPAFDLVVCDEAHRTTGVEDPAEKSKDEQKVSPFRLVHDKDRIHAHKRLYATATPRLYTESAKGKAADRNLEIYSMNDESVYGPEFYKMAFSEAIEGDWLTDYKVIILTLKADQISEAMGNMLAAEEASGLNLDDAVKLLGCWDALADPEGVLANRDVTGDKHNPLLRAITFTNTIKSSKMVETYWQRVVDAVPGTDGFGAAGRPAAAGRTACGWDAELARPAAQAGLAEERGNGKRASLPGAQQCPLPDRGRRRAGPGRGAVSGAA